MTSYNKRLGTRKLGIRFGDNDFYFMCTAFLRVLLPDAFTHHTGLDLMFTKAQIVELFNGMAPSLYLLKQNCWKYESGHIPAYAKISEDSVYLDDEVDKYLAESNNDCNGEFFSVDFGTTDIIAH